MFELLGNLIGVLIVLLIFLVVVGGIIAATRWIAGML
jgi:hypothetical protein